MSEPMTPYQAKWLQYADDQESDRDHFKDVCAIAVLQGLLSGHEDWSVPSRREALVIRAWDIADAMTEERDSR